MRAEAAGERLEQLRTTSAACGGPHRRGGRMDCARDKGVQHRATGDEHRLRPRTPREHDEQGPALPESHHQEHLLASR